MRIVGIDTSSATASAALIEDGRLIAERRHPETSAGQTAGPTILKSNHAEILLPLIESVIVEAHTTLAEVSGLAIAIGPGSFTGLRIGLSTVKGLAYGSRVPVVGVSTLLAQAARAGDPSTRFPAAGHSLGIPPVNRGVESGAPGLHGGLHFDGVVCALLDARKNEVYAALFRKRRQELARLTEDFLAPAGSVIEQVRSATGDMPCLFIGDGARRYEKLLLDAFGGKARLCAEESISSCATAVACLGMERLRRSETDDLGKLVPVYLRPSEAESKRSNRI